MKAWSIARRVLIALLIVAAMLVALYMLFTAYVWWSLIEGSKPTTRLDAYPSLLKDWAETGMVDHFSRAIPAQARNVSLKAYPGMLQGSGSFQLRMTLPAAEVAAIDARMQTEAMRRCPPECTRGIDEPEFWSVPRLEAGQTDEGDTFERDFVVYALYTDGDWNHPTGKGIAVSVKRNEVVYWAVP
jgi:hypothetical protein